MKKSFPKKIFWWIFLGVLAISALGGGLYWNQIVAATATPTAQPMQTAKVRKGDLVITASGAGNIIPHLQADLGFRTSGILKEVNVSIGQSVTAGQVMASLEDALQQAQLAQAEAEFQALFSEASLAQAKITVANSDIATQTAIEDLQYLVSPEVYFWETELDKAKQALLVLNADTNASAQQKANAQKSIDRAQTNLNAAQDRYQKEYVPATFTYTYTDLETNEEITTTIAPTSSEIALARAKVDTARFALLDARSLLEALQAGSSAITGPLAAVQGTETAKIEQARLALENARLTLENTHLVAPIDGVVISLDAVDGQTVNTTRLLTLATTQDLQVRYYLEETDMDKAVVGNKINIIFDAYPDTVIEGTTTAVEQVLQVIDGTPVIVSWASISNPGKLPILSGMTVDVEVIGGEAKDALLVPVQALREIAPGSFAVFVVQPDNSLKLTPVSIGLRDFASAVVLDGLKLGDVVSTGTVETK